VGGGVSGLFAAHNLAKYGLRVAVIEMKKEEDIGVKVCGDAIGKHHFEELGLEPPTLGFDGENVYKGVKLVSPDEQHILTVSGEGYALNRKNFGLRLYRMAVNSGADVFTEHIFIKPVIEGAWIRGIVAKSLSGAKTTFSSHIVIDASGVPAVVRSSLPREWWVAEPVPKEDYNITFREIWNGDIEIGTDYAWIYLNTEIAPGGYWWLFPKGKGIYNVGLGVQWRKNAPNPRIQFEKYIRARYKNRVSEVIHAGGGIVPTRRPIPCMVWNGFIVVGDAALTANPVHGGGIGSSMLSAKLAADTIIESLSRGEPSLEALWSYHIRYHRAYGAKQASLDILRMFLQTMSNEGLNFVFKSKLVNGAEVYDIGAKGVLAHTIFNKLGSILHLATRPRFLAKLVKLKHYMDKARELYLNYPKSPKEYEKWRSEEKALFNEYKEWLAREA
ncbi:MAG TPA: NAD(P)/FAD-dependent oxidoreductase, partial [Ignisphaera sp.]|nr:NAD(P)/FAD-dependent oxidoreductase [Ignisphaera sp.]